MYYKLLFFTVSVDQIAEMRTNETSKIRSREKENRSRGMTVFLNARSVESIWRFSIYLSCSPSHFMPFARRNVTHTRATRNWSHQLFALHIRNLFYYILAINAFYDYYVVYLSYISNKMMHAIRCALHFQSYKELDSKFCNKHPSSFNLSNRSAIQ